MMILKYPIALSLAAMLIGCSYDAEQSAPVENPIRDVNNELTSSGSVVSPASDPNNLDGWVLNTMVSDEFDGDEIDHDKWLVEGLNGDFYIWKGRPPSQFAPHNVVVQDGILKLRSQWEPDYAFAQESYADGANNDAYGVYEGEPMPVTTAGIVSKHRFLNGYMEVRSMAGDAAMTSSFWMIGHQQELDVYEQMGKPKIKGSITENKLKMTVHDWSPPAVRPTRVLGYSEMLPFRVADDFHVYGAEWGVDYLKIFVDGKMVHHVTQDEVGGDFVLNNPMEIWLDSEIFTWLGLPDEAELPVDFEVDYVRVWQKPSDNLLDEHRAFYGFEGPYLDQTVDIPLTMLPEDLDTNDYQKFWEIPEANARQFIITKRRGTTGVNSLKYQTIRSDEEAATITGPPGTMSLPAGEYELSFKIWLNHGYQPEFLRMSLLSPNVEIGPIALDSQKRGEWLTLTLRFTKDAASNADDRLEIKVVTAETQAGATDFYLDDIVIRAVE